ncbi:MAG: flagellar hook-basal body protein [Defluviitaleaceae bacterium]|nr:flagellar hook-basal body protein [Defluviitaleaceae bacterium]
MMRSLWTAASGMTTQQLSVDTIANNMANVNTTAFKRERIEFQSVLYETLQNAGHNPGVVGNRPNNLQVGHGVRAVASTRNFTMGHLEPTGIPTDFAINGTGFFGLDRGDGLVGYTRDGAFHLTTIGGGQMMLVNSAGLPIMSSTGDHIVFPETINITTLGVSQEGHLSYIGPDGVVDLNVSLGIVQFPNRQGLESIGGNMFIETPASGFPILEDVGTVAQRSHVMQGHLERSNVLIADEMVNLIVSQRAFELNSRIITTSDDMLQQANNMRR